MSFGVKVSTASLHRLFYNAKLLQVGSLAKPMYVYVDAHSNTMSMATSDRHCYLTDKTEVEAPWSFHMEIKPADVKAIELQLRDITDDMIEFEWTSPGEFLLPAGNTGLADKPYLGYICDVTMSDDGDQFADMLDFSFLADLKPVAAFALNADRFRKVSLVKPDYPVDMLPVMHPKYGRIIAFKKGPSVVGALATMDREKILAKSGDQDVLW